MGLADPRNGPETPTIVSNSSIVLMNPCAKEGSNAMCYIENIVKIDVFIVILLV